MVGAHPKDASVRCSNNSSVFMGLRVSGAPVTGESSIASFASFSNSSVLVLVELLVVLLFWSDRAMFGQDFPRHGQAPPCEHDVARGGGRGATTRPENADMKLFIDFHLHRQRE